MTYGFRAFNDSAYVQIDSETPRLCALYNGTYQGSSYQVTINFPSPIATPEPPCIFIRPTTTSETELYRSITVNGSPGNWVGFSISTSNVGFLPSGKWFASVFGSRGAASYGLRLFGADGSVLYDSGAPAVIVTGVVQAWTYAGRSAGTLANYYFWRANRQVAEDEYIMINPFSLPAITATTPAASPLAVRINYVGGFVEIFQEGPSGTVMTNKGNIPAVFGRLHY